MEGYSFCFWSYIRLFHYSYLSDCLFNIYFLAVSFDVDAMCGVEHAAALEVVVGVSALVGCGHTVDAHRGTEREGQDCVRSFSVGGVVSLVGRDGAVFGVRDFIESDTGRAVCYYISGGIGVHSLGNERSAERVGGSRRLVVVSDGEVIRAIYVCGFSCYLS